MGEKREKWIGLGLALLVLAGMLLFFEKAHPLVILDADDWTYISQSRAAIPATKLWNPARILPEILMPYASSLGVLLFSRLGYVQAITAMNGLVLSLFISAYVWEFFRLLTRRLSLGAAGAALLSALFLLLHFLIFRREPAGNRHLFYAYDVTCIYYYVIPGLLNAALVLRLLRTGEHRRFFEKEKLLQKGILAALVYLAVFSNLFESVILAAFCGWELLLALLRGRKNRGTGRAFRREQGFSAAVLLLWLASVWFESRGGRAGTPNETPFGQALGECLRSLPSFFGGMNRFFLLLVCGCALALLLLLFGRRREETRPDAGGVLLPLGLTGAATLAFLTLASAKVSSAYILRCDVMFGVGFALVAGTVLALALLLRRCPRLLVLLPLLLVILFSETDTRLRTFAEPNCLLAPPEECLALDQTVIDQIVAADRAGESRVTVYVPDYGSSDNWPQSVYLGPRAAASLYKHGLTGRLLEVEVVPRGAITDVTHPQPEK